MTTRSPRARTVSWLASIAVLALLATSAKTASAAGRNVALDWTAPTGCPSRELMEDRIARVVGESTRARETIRAHVLVASDSAGATRADVELMTTDQRISRHVEGDSCASVSEAIVLIIALAIDPEEAPGAAAPLVTAPDADAPRRPDDVTARHPLFVSASARLDVASVPAPALGGELAVGWRARHFELELAAALLAPARATLPARPDQGADIRLTDLGARGCYQLFDATLDVGPCAGLHARWLSASGFGTDEPRDVTGLFAVASLGALATARLSPRLALRLAAETAFPLSRPSFQIDAAGMVHRTPAAAFRTALGAEVHF